jgi:hypothetical protein
MLQAYPYFYVPYADDLPTEPAEGVACCTCVGRSSLVHDMALGLHLHTVAICTGIPNKQEIVPQLFVHQSSSAEQSSSSSSSSSAPAHD